jgi:hypothetical protein|eukprot:COSAG01_NODE_3824_length_5658_cov_8.480482_6_plen_67_part_00
MLQEADQSGDTAAGQRRVLDAAVVRSSYISVGSALRLRVTHMADVVPRARCVCVVDGNAKPSIHAH